MGSKIRALMGKSAIRSKFILATVPLLVAFIAVTSVPILEASSPLTVIRESSGYTPLGVSLDGTAWATGMGQSRFLYKSTNEGQTWTQAYALPSSPLSYILAMNQLSSGTLLMGANSGGYYTMYRSTDGGSSWATTTQEYPNSGEQLVGLRGPGNVGYYLALGQASIAETTAGAFLITYNTQSGNTYTNYLYRSVDDGRTWQIRYTLSEFRHGHGLHADGNVLYALWGDSSGDGIRRSTDNGLTWTNTCADYQCVAVGATTNSTGKLFWISDNPASSGYGQNKLYRIDDPATPGSIATTVLSVSHVSYGARTAPNGQIIIGQTYEPYTSRFDPSLHLYVSLDDGVSWIDALQRSFPTTEGNYHLRAMGFFPSGNIFLQMPGGYIVASLAGGTLPPPPTTTAPANTELPTISGTATEEQVLTGADDTWSGNPVPALTRQWLRCNTSGDDCTAIGSATSASYTLTTSDVGSTIRIRVTASNSAGTASADSTATAAVAASATPPSNPTNLAPNPSFELDPFSSYYTHGTASYSWTTDAAHSGSRSLKIVSTSWSLTRWLSNTNSIAASAGKTYVVSGYVRTISGSGTLAVNFWKSDRSYTGTTCETTSSSGDWALVSTSCAAPAGTAFVRLEMRLWVPGTVWFDDVSVNQG